MYNKTYLNQYADIIWVIFYHPSESRRILDESGIFIVIRKSTQESKDLSHSA